MLGRRGFFLRGVGPAGFRDRLMEGGDVKMV
jgi:hypothetical protein